MCLDVCVAGPYILTATVIRLLVWASFYWQRDCNSDNCHFLRSPNHSRMGTEPGGSGCKPQALFFELAVVLGFAHCWAYKRYSSCVFKDRLIVFAESRDHLQSHQHYMSRHSNVQPLRHFNIFKWFHFLVNFFAWNCFYLLVFIEGQFHCGSLKFLSSSEH